MSVVKRCTQCGAELPARVPKGLCPRCALQGLLKVNPNLAEVPTLAAERSEKPVQPESPSPATHFGDYELLEEIARGGMGVVFKARQKSLNRTVAVKMILAGQFAGKQIGQRFKSEAGAAAILQHPNIVAVHEVGVREGQHFFSMDYVEGQTLSQLVANCPLPPQKAARYVKIIADAIGYAHQQGILHRDLKPSNVLIDAATDQPRVTDFGLAKRLNCESSITVTGQVLGSPNFIPPEQASAQRGKVGRHSDVYGLGGILYFLLTARAPFQGATLETTIHEVLTTEPLSPRALNPSVPRDLETICLKCLEKETSRRYQTAQELAAELERFLRAEPIHARPVSRTESAWRWCWRKPALAGSLGAAAILLLVVAIGSPIMVWRINHARELAEDELYVANMHEAEAALEERDLGRVRRLLEAHRPRGKTKDRRDFAWRSLWQRSRGDELASLAGHSNFLRSVRFAPTGTTLASRSADNAVKIWDWAVRREILSLRDVSALGGFTPDGKRLAVGKPGGAVKLIEVATGETVRSIENAGILLALLDDGKTVATTSDEFVVKFWDVTTGRATLVVPGRGGEGPLIPEFGLAVPITGDGKHVASIKEGVRVWNLAEQKVADFTAEGHRLCVQVSADGEWLAVGGFDGVMIWKISEGQASRRKIKAHPDPIISLAFSPDGRMLATASEDQTINVWETTAGKHLSTLRGHESTVWTVAFSPDGKQLVSGGKDNLVKVWPVEQKAAAALLTGLWRPLLWSSDSSLLAAGQGGSTVQLLDKETLEPRQTLRGARQALAFDPGGTTILVRETNGAIGSWRIAGQTIQRMIERNESVENGWSSEAVSPDQRLIAIGKSSGLVHLVDVKTGSVHLLTGHTREVMALIFSFDSATLISGSRDGTVRFWDVSRRQCADTIAAHNEHATCLALSPDGRLLATGGTDHLVKLWNFKTRRLLKTLIGHRRVVGSLAFSPDGKTLASGGGDRSVRLWSIPLQREVTAIKLYEPLTGDEEELLFMAFSPDGNNLATMTRYGKLKVLRAATFKETDAVRFTGRP